MNRKHDVISVIVPIYRVEEYLNQCIESIVNQTYQNLQIILVDDGSPDRCGEMCEEWARRDKRIEVLHKKNGGLSDARNAGLAIATGDCIAFVDSDDWIEPTMYEAMLSVLAKENADLVACGIVDSYPDKEIIHSYAYAAGGSEKFLKMIYQNTTFPVSACNKLYKKNLWDDFKFPVGKLCEDAFTTYLLLDRASKIVQIPDRLYHYRIRESSIMTSEFKPARMDEEAAWRQNYQYMQRHHPELAKYAYDFYLQKVNVLIHAIPFRQRVEYSKEYNYLHNILRKNLKYILFQSSLGWKYRIRFFIDVLKLKTQEH